jgi:serine phosphatase RsbU (regulator of sigma subunit)/pSer/pThr/pTyr-binding forkhead associated (FHA) protein
LVAPSLQSSSAVPKELLIRDIEGKVTYLPLDRDRIMLGRSSACQLCYPDDSGLSRQHMALSNVNGQWIAEDLGSKNGTLVNDRRIEGATPVGVGDKIVAGHLELELSSALPGSAIEKVEFVEAPESSSVGSTTLVASLDEMLGTQSGEMDQTSIIRGNPQMGALIRAGRELAGHRPLNELFEVIMDLSMEAVLAGRGVLMTLEGDELRARAARGAGFKISNTVRNRVIKEKSSLLVRDAQMDMALKAQMSIVQQSVRSMMAVPLQTNDRVIGLIYVDSPDMIREFTREDLGLLTVMANVAAIRIEHARLNEIELVERAMSKELDQAAHIQMGLLPSEQPKVEGMDIFGSTAPCRTVGGDYYDYLEFPDGRIGMLVGDVAGKGMPASLLMSSLQARVKVLFEDGDRLAEKITRLNKATTAHTPDNRFITFFMTVADPVTGELVFTNAGHNPPVLVRASGGFELLAGGGMILGILPMAEYTEVRAKMEPGDTLVLFSDGVTEAVNRSDEDFGETRLAELVASLSGRPAREIVKAVHDEVARFTQGAPPADDITVVVARRL